MVGRAVPVFLHQAAGGPAVAPPDGIEQCVVVAGIPGAV